MLIFGHTGITLGAAVLTGVAFFRKHSPDSNMEEKRLGPDRSTEVSPAHTIPDTQRLSWFTLLAGKIDIRILLIGSLLPDIIDKPVGRFFFRDVFSNGRIMAHTLVFLILLTLVGFYLLRNRGGTGLLVFSFGTLTHLIFDQMWLTPRTLFWPFYGFTFERADLADWIPNMGMNLLTNPQVFVPELVGGVVLLWFAAVLVRKRKVFYFIRRGRLQ
ncbi:MAG: metal-dependent hydrolase [Dehalococcoidales bacterium]|nr:metal-dependent hydrolase [Dehalococcoidales bacterium]